MITAVKTKLASHPTAKVLVTGHSLGAAIATLAAIEIREQINPTTLRFYTFGSPRVGNQEFSDYVMKYFDDGYYSRVTHFDDGVVHAPLKSMGFNHAGNEVWYKNKDTDMTYQECENSIGKSESSACSNQYIIQTGIAAHLTYLGKPISNMCTSKDSTEGKTNSEELFLSAWFSQID